MEEFKHANINNYLQKEAWGKGQIPEMASGKRIKMLSREKLMLKFSSSEKCRILDLSLFCALKNIPLVSHTSPSEDHI